MVTRRAVVGLLVGVSCLLSRHAHAAGMEFPDIGALALGRGAAVAAQPQGGLAFQYNPAGFADQKGLSFTIDGKLAWPQITFTTPQNASGSNTQLPYVGPSGLIASYGFGQVGPLLGLTVAVGATGPSGIGQSSYPATGPQRYELISSNYLIAYYGAAVAARITEWFALGVTFQLTQGTAQFSEAVRPLSGDDPSSDAIVTFQGASGVAPTAVIGGTFNIGPEWTIGASYRPRVTFSPSGSLTSQLPAAANALQATQDGNSATLSINLPNVWRLGVQYAPVKGLQIEVDGVYEAWSALQDLEIATHDITLRSGASNFSTQLGSIKSPRDFNDAVSVRVGGEYEWLPQLLTVRAGYVYETSAIPSRTVSVQFANWGRHMVGVGFTLDLFGVDLDVAYAHHFIPTQHVTDSIMTQDVTPSLIPGVPNPQPQVIGNGTYQASLDVLAIGIRVPLDNLRSSLQSQP